MKNLFFYVCCLLLLIITGCNNNETKQSSQSELVNNCRQISVTDQQNTKIFLSQQFLIFKDKTEHVKFNYNEFMQFITDMDIKNGSPAKDIYLEYGAYTRPDAVRYIATHCPESQPCVPPIQFTEINDKPCLIEAYLKSNQDFAYDDDKGTICPPPGSCQTNFIINKEITDRNPFIPEATKDNYTNTYDADNLKLTRRVKFDIACIKSCKKRIDGLCGFETKYIYFFMGAYTNAMSKINHQEAGKPCLLVAYNSAKDPDKDPHEFTFFDFGILDFEKIR